MSSLCPAMLLPCSGEAQPRVHKPSDWIPLCLSSRVPRHGNGTQGLGARKMRSVGSPGPTTSWPWLQHMGFCCICWGADEVLWEEMVSVLKGVRWP